MEEEEIESSMDPIDKRAILQNFWHLTVKNYLETQVCDIDAKDIGNPQAMAEFAEDCA